MARKFDTAKLKSDCSACDALCCAAPSFEAPDYLKSMATMGSGMYSLREQKGYTFCLTFDCHGVG